MLPLPVSSPRFFLLSAFCYFFRFGLSYCAYMTEPVRLGVFDFWHRRGRGCGNAGANKRGSDLSDRRDAGTASTGDFELVPIACFNNDTPLRLVSVSAILHVSLVGLVNAAEP